MAALHPPRRSAGSASRCRTTSDRRVTCCGSSSMLVLTRQQPDFDSFIGGTRRVRSESGVRLSSQTMFSHRSTMECVEMSPARIACCSSGCGGSIHAQQGIISSPNWPANYNYSIECVWDVTVASGYHIKWTFTQPFDLEITNPCTADYVQVNCCLGLITPIPHGPRQLVTKQLTNELEQFTVFR